MIDVWSFWGCLGSIFGRLGGSWGVFLGSWGVLGGSWRGLGGSWDRLGQSWVVRCRFCLSAARCPPALGKFWEPKRGPRWSQNATQEGPKSKTKTKMKKEGFEDRLGAVLGRFWVVLGAVLGSFF